MNKNIKMKLYQLIAAIAFSSAMLIACNNNNKQPVNTPGTDTTSTNPTTNAEDYHNDQRQRIPVTDSSNTIGTDTLSGSVAAPNIGTEKSYNASKGSKDSTH